LKPVPSLAEHIAALEQLRAGQPPQLETELLLGQLYVESGQPLRALYLYQHALTHWPEEDRLWHNSGVLYEQLAQWEEAVAAYQAALRCRPRSSGTWFRLGRVLQLQGQLRQAAHAFQQSWELAVDHLPALGAWLEVLVLLGDTAQVMHLCEVLGNPAATAWYRRLPRSVRQVFQQQRWRYQALWVLQAFAREDVSDEALIAALATWGDVYAPGKSCYHGVRDRNPERPLRVGYLSREFGNDTPAAIYAGLFRHHDPAQVEVIFYDDSSGERPWKNWLRALPHRWVSVAGQDNEAVARQFAADEVDILVDLCGLINAERLPLFAQRLAPVQLSGGTNPPFSTGIAHMDGLFSDMWLTPPEVAAQYREPVLYLSSFLHWTPPTQVYPLTPCPQLATGHLTLGSANSLNKYTPHILGVWADLLQALPDARLLLKTPSLDDPFRAEEIRAVFAAAGVAERLDLVGALPAQDHLQWFYERVDIALDPWPYGGGVTSFEAFYMGVPVVTLTGRRVGSSVLQVLGHPEWMAEDALAYRERVIHLAADLPLRQQLRAQLRQDLLASPVCNGVRFAQEVETHYRACWLQWLKSTSEAGM
jgi:protein O-GlcNAc transferase